MENNQPGPSRARAKTPKILQSPNGEVVKLTRKMRSIITRIPTAKDVGEIADEMNCSKGMVYHTLRIPAVQEYLKSQMEAAGITHGLLMQRIREGIDATKEGKGSVVDKESGTIKADQVVDFGERRANVELALKLQGLSQAAPEPGGQTINNNILFNIVQAARDKRGLK